MESQVTNNANALRLFFTEDVFLVEDKSVKIPHSVENEAVLYSSSLTTVEVVEHEFDNENVSVSVGITSIETPNSAQKAEILPVNYDAKPEKTFKFLGGNKKAVLILVHDKNYEVSSEQGRELLRKIVKAIDLSSADFALINYANYEDTDYAELHAFFKPAIMLAFGVEANQLKLDLQWNNEIIVHKSIRMIFAPNLHPLDADLQAKKSLWANLQKLK